MGLGFIGFSGHRAVVGSGFRVHSWGGGGLLWVKGGSG